MMGRCSFLRKKPTAKLNRAKAISSGMPKIRILKEMIESTSLPIEIEVDGGIDPTTAPEVAAAGAGILVAGSAIFGQADPVKAMESLRLAATTVVA